MSGLLAVRLTWSSPANCARRNWMPPMCSPQHDEGILCAPTAFGKTALAAWMIAARKVNTLVLVHRQQLLDQWHARLAMFLNLPAKSIGQIGGGTTERSGCVDIAIIQSSHDKAGVKDFVAEYGQVIVDECHHLSAFTFEQVMKQVKAKYVARPDSNSRAQRWTPSHHLYAVRSDTIQAQRPLDDGCLTFRA